MEKDDRSVSPRSGKALAGLILVGVGAVLLGREMGLDVPPWLLTWEMLLIGFGVFLGARRMFRPGGWLIIVLVGTVFLVDRFSGFTLKQYLWPLVIILVGLWMIVKPRRKKKEWEDWANKYDSRNTNDWIEVNSVFSGGKEKILTKEFKGGEVNSVFSGNDFDFSQADINGTAVMEVNLVFGGVKMIIPPNWRIQSSVDSVFGSVEDKRKDPHEVSEKTLVLKGSVVFGGIEIKSF